MRGHFWQRKFPQVFSLCRVATLKKLCCCNWETGKKYSGYKKYLLPKIEIKLKCNSYFYFRQKLEPTMTTWSLYMLAIWMLLTWFYWKSTYYLVYKNFKFEEITNPPSLSRHIFCVSKNPSIRYVDISIKYGWIAKYSNDIRVKILYYAQQNL